MADKKIQMTQRNATNDAWDNLYPKTTGDQVVASDGTTFESHLSDYMYQTAAGTATEITLTIVGTLANGYPITFIASANNNGSATTINGKPLYKPNTTTAPNLVAGKAYTVWYNQSGDCFFIKASAEGNTVAAHVLAGDTFSNDEDTGLLGTMPNNGSNNIQAQRSSNVSIPQGYYDGTGVVLATFSGAGDNEQSSCVQAIGLQYTAYYKYHEIRANKAGTYRVKFDLRSYNSSYKSYARIYVNDIPVGIERMKQSATYTTYAEDITVNAGDLIQLYAYSVTGSSFGYVKNFMICTNEEALFNVTFSFSG